MHEYASYKVATRMRGAWDVMLPLVKLALRLDGSRKLWLQSVYVTPNPVVDIFC